MADEWDAFLFSADRNVRYVWNPDEKRFHIDSDQSTGDTSLFDFSKQGLVKNFKNELEKLEKSELKLKQDWLQKLLEREFTELNKPEVVENLNTIEIMNMNDDKNALLSASRRLQREKRFPESSEFRVSGRETRPLIPYTALKYTVPRKRTSCFMERRVLQDGSMMFTEKAG